MKARRELRGLHRFLYYLIIVELFLLGALVVTDLASGSPVDWLQCATIAGIVVMQILQLWLGLRGDKAN